MSKPHVARDAHLPRKIMHLLAASIIPGLYHLALVPDSLAISLVGGIAFLWFGVEGWRLRHPGFNRVFIRWFRFLMKEKEVYSFTGVAYLLGGSALAMMLFAKPIAVAALFFIALGDPVAALVGKRYGRLRMPNGKSVEGSLAMFVVCVASGLLVTPALSLAAVVAGGGAATLAEFVAGKIDDNLIAPVFSGAVMAVMSV